MKFNTGQNWKKFLTISGLVSTHFTSCIDFFTPFLSSMATKCDNFATVNVIGEWGHAFVISSLDRCHEFGLTSPAYTRIVLWENNLFSIETLQSRIALRHGGSMNIRALMIIMTIIWLSATRFFFYHPASPLLCLLF